MLSESRFSKDVQKAEKLIKDASKTLDNIRKFIDEEDKESAINESYKYVRISEKIVNTARLMPISSGSPLAKDKVNEIIAEENEVLVEYTQEGWFHVNIPSLLPKKEKDKGNPTYIRATLNAGIKKFFSENEKKPLMSDCVMIFKHNYSQDRPEREYRDHDNIELNAIVDMVTLHSLLDDSPMKCKHFYCSAVAEKDSTDVFVVPKSDFIEWLNKYNII